MNSTGLTLAPAASFSAGVVGEGVTETVGGVEEGVGGATASAVSSLVGAGEGGGAETG
jgi:hypothetical protein